LSRGRKPRPDELELWRKVAATSEPYQNKKHEDFASLIGTDKPEVAQPPRREVFEPSLGSTPVRKPTAATTSVNLAPALPDLMRQQPVQMDRKTFGQMIRGRLSPEGRLDLHGMTLDQAHPALNRFILKEYAAGKRLVLVITGKGKNRPDDGPIPLRTGILRHQVPIWLSSAPLRHAVLQATPAHKKHGGIGAYYVYLRRTR
jgi:DNA-nicking Smr family endonuclease